MKNEIIKFSTGKVIVDLSNVFFYLSFADEIVLNEEYSPDLLYYLRELFNPDADLVYNRNDRICPHCGNIMTKNGKTQAVSINKNMDMKYQTYECKIEKWWMWQVCFCFCRTI